MTATFSEALDPATVNTTNFELRNSSGQLVTAAVTWDPATLRAILDPSANLAFSASYTATVRGGSGGVADLAGNPLAANVTWTFTTAAPIVEISIWPGAVSPDFPNSNDGSTLELGVKFRASTAGQITAIRFYKATQDTGTHVGSLWSSTGTRLATATFTNETASGWQRVELTPPVIISPNTTYVASYFSAAGYYTATLNYFTQAVVNGPLTALADGTDGVNGVYRYGASAFPNQSFLKSNYWVDVVFVPDTTPPTVTGVSPPNGATGVASARTWPRCSARR